MSLTHGRKSDIGRNLSDTGRGREHQPHRADSCNRLRTEVRIGRKLKQRWASQLPKVRIGRKFE